MLLVYKLSLHQIDRIANILYPASTVGGKRQKISFKKYKSRNYPLSNEEKGRKKTPLIAKTRRYPSNVLRIISVLQL
jgi:hypothetical protein